MPNILDADGLQVETRDEIIERLETSFRTIYGADINLDSDTPDGQLINILAQGTEDILDLLVAIFNSFDPDKAIGRTLDARASVNGIQRQGGTSTITDITITTSDAVTLYGLDQDVEPVFTVSDGEGNNFKLITTTNIASSGDTVARFQSENTGEVLTTINTITNPVTVILGVTAINNPTVAIEVGITEESDAAFRLRRSKSVNLATQGYLTGLIAALLNVSGVTSAFVFENDTSAPDEDGTPSHSIWPIVGGAGDPSEIAQAIYNKRNGGAGMRGEQSFEVPQIDGTTFTVFWDIVASENVFVVIDVTSIDGVNSPNVSAIRTGLSEQLVTPVNEDINSNIIGSLVQGIDDNALVNKVRLSTGKTQTIKFPAVPTSGDFKLSFNGNSTAAIAFNADASAIQTELRALAGLDTVTVSGDYATQFDIVFGPEIDTVNDLILIKENTLDTDPYLELGDTILIKPTSKRYQLTYDLDNIIVYNIQLSPSNASTTSNQTQVFTASGGYGSYTYEILVDSSSGATIDSEGLYTAGTATGIDTIKVTDELGNSTTVEIGVL